MSVKPDPQDLMVVKKLSQSVLKFLGVTDEDFTISNFVLDLYKRSNGSSGPNLQKFQDILNDNGGDEFPKEFVESCFNIIVESTPRPTVVVKKEYSGFSGLNIPDKEVKWDNILVKTEPQDNMKQEPHDMKQELQEVKREPQDKFKRQSRENIHESSSSPVEVGQICRGYVSNLTAYGAFIRLNDPRSFQSGLCHISQISFDGKTRIQEPADVLNFNQEVFVKITSIEQQQSGYRKSRDKISLTMRGIDQETGVDRSEELQQHEEERHGREAQQSTKGTKRRLTSPERWEISQLIASGAVSAKDYPELAGVEDPNAAFEDTPIKEEEEIEVEIELKKEEPKFLKGQTQNSIELEPVKIFKNPEGSLNRSAMNGSKLAREFKDEKLKERMEKEKITRKEKSRSTDSHDPLNSMQSTPEPSTNDPKTQNFISDWKKSQMTKSIKYGKRTTLPIKEQRESLPVFTMRQELVNAVRDNQFLVVVGETGSGKTTQIVQYLMEEGFNNDSSGQTKIIGCTQPRRVAAESVAKRVSQEVGCVVGSEVGYTIRFEDKTSSCTKIKYMTDGMLEREALNDPFMKKYSVIMLDEAHERTIATDVLFALLKKAAIKNPELRIITTSATLDSDKFSKYFNDCPVMKIPGRTFPVEVLYTKEPEMDYLAAALDSVIQIHLSEPEGDILVFLTGQEEIDTSCEALFERMKVLGDTVPELIILPMYSSLPLEMQSRIFDPTPNGSRKVILATNIAETSITIDGIYYVVDPGFVKINAYDAKLGMDSLIVSPISQAQANQRSGRAGRTGPGKCYRLYTENAYKNEMMANTIPEIQRQNLAHTILMLKAMGINDLLNFEFMDPPPTNTMLTALQDLYTLSALDDDGYLTKLGRKMADFPMEPALAKTLLTSVEFGCSQEILSIVAMLSVQTVFYRPKEKQALADQRKARFHHSQGDHLTFLNVYRAWETNGRSKTWCQDNYIQDRSMKRAFEVRKQISTIMSKFGHGMSSCGSQLDRVRRALTAGFFKHSSKRDPQEGYKTLVEQTPVYLHPSSSLFGKTPEYVLYHTLLLTTKEYMHCVTVIEPKWLAELAPSYFKVADPTVLNQQKRNMKIEPLYDKYAPKDAWRLSAQNEVKRRALGNLNDGSFS